jgi:hypothetical protein
MIAFIKALQRLKLERQKSPAFGTGKQKAKILGLVWRNRKKISQLINTYLSLPLFLLIILHYPPPLPPIKNYKLHRERERSAEM